MHYNPASIRLCEETVSTLRPRLGAVVLETCPKRWEKTLTYQPAGSVMRSVLDNEFQSAAEAAGDDAEIVLGDQEIAALGENLGRLVKETAFDLLYPPRAFTGGWKSYADDVREAVATEIAKQFAEMGMTVVATGGTAKVIEEAGVPVTVAPKIHEGRPHIGDMLRNDEISLMIVTSSGDDTDLKDGREIRRTAVGLKVPLVTTMAGAKATCNAVRVLQEGKLEMIALQDFF